MSGLVPVTTNAHSSVEIDNSCNDCCPSACCWPRRIKYIKPQRNKTMPHLQKIQDDELATTIKVHSVSQPSIMQSTDGDWEIKIDGKKAE